MMPAPRMYVPRHYAQDDARPIIEGYPLATLVTQSPEGMFATALPMIFETDDPEEDRLISHLARRNMHAQALPGTADALAIFTGPNAYISPGWYREKPEVPTWNYITAQIRGSIQLLEQPAEAMAVLERSVAVLERDQEVPWTTTHQTEQRLEMLLRQVVAFRMTITQVVAATKLSQAHPPGDRLRVIRGLLRVGDERSVAVARLMADMPNE